ncbi:zinc finger CCCH domain-containing protein 54-like isoform X1 [Canna indica]|uniref:Zinc finger CCCH domain-containing protein 54-like isoform X1 n=1 Tax=Canna indica TaxID=4628 RepID=A0AAQ3L632_9LILI|nr:zinc finger CCCH domain-containing protein 54-like isoform X1 [Canna indica]
MGFNMDAGGRESSYYDMDWVELLKITFTRVQKVEPAETAVKIIGCIFLQGPSNAEMFRLAFGSDNILLSKINDAKHMLDLLVPNKSIPDNQIGTCSPSASHAISSQSNLQMPTHYCLPQLSVEQHSPSHNLSPVPRPYSDFVSSLHHNQPQPMDQLDNANHMNNYYYYQETALASSINKRSPSFSDLPPKNCHYFNKGYCKHGNSCKYSHAQPSPEGYSQVFGPNMTEYPNEEHPLTPKSLQKLELEIVELLRSKRGMPVSIASLPMLYAERYGKNLQADGYLTESQRHGKAGYNLTKLLSNLRKSIRLIEKPHGQHSVVLAEDAPKHLEGRNERNDLSPTVSSSHQIYLTFPAESTFTEDDVSNYFKQYGQVRDVRLPSLEKRMYGFVSFVHPETVSMILEQRCPHYICGARVLVKQYKEKSKTFDRMHSENSRPKPPYHLRNPEMDHEAHSGSAERARNLKDYLIEQELERESIHLSRFNFAPMTLTQQNCSTHGMEGRSNLLGHLTHEFGLLNVGSTNDGKARQLSSYSDQESGHTELPENLFSPPVGSSIPAVI